MRHGTGAALLLSLTISAFGVGCGAKTGLYVPDGGDNVPDADFDAGVDAPMLDAGMDADLCVEVPFDGGPIELDLSVEAVIGAADIAFLIDVTASMDQEISRIRNRLRDVIAPAIREAIPDSRLAVATFADFPVGDYGSAARGDTPFQLQLPMTDDITAVQAAVNAIEMGDGRDIEESQVEALYQLATGEGRGSYVPPSAGCPSGGRGYACFRGDAMAVVLLFTDAEFHNGPGGDHPYGSDVVPRPADYDDALAALRRLDMRVIGFDSGRGVPRRHLERVAIDTGAVSASGPLVYDIGSMGESLSNSVVEAIRTFATTASQDIDAIFLDADPGDGIDATEFVEALRPLRAEPMSGVGAIDREAGVFRDVVAGTLLTWELSVRNDAVVPGPRPQRFRLEVIFRGDARRRIRRVFVDIVVPGEDGAGCEL